MMDTYRVIYTTPSGTQRPSAPMSRDAALESFDHEMAAGAKASWLGPERVRVISEQTWLAAVETALTAGWERSADALVKPGGAK